MSLTLSAVCVCLFSLFLSKCVFECVFVVSLLTKLSFSSSFFQHTQFPKLSTGSCSGDSGSGRTHSGVDSQCFSVYVCERVCVCF